MTTVQSVVTILAVVAGTILTRFLPFLIFPGGEEPTGLYHLAGNGSAPCGYWAVGSLLPEGCVFFCLSWAAGDDFYRFCLFAAQVEKEYFDEYCRGNGSLYGSCAVFLCNIKFFISICYYLKSQRLISGFQAAINIC